LAIPTICDKNVNAYIVGLPLISENYNNRADLRFAVMHDMTSGRGDIQLATEQRFIVLY